MQHNPYYHHHQSFVNKCHSYLAHHSILLRSSVKYFLDFSVYAQGIAISNLQPNSVN
jgi:hypothetical protein